MSVRGAAQQRRTRASMRGIVCACVAAVLLPWRAPAQEAPLRPELTVTVTPATVVVGEPFAVRLRVRAPAGVAIHFPAVPDSGNTVEATDPRAIEDSSSSAVFDQTAVYRFMAWEPGRRDVPLGDVRWEQGRGSEALARAPIRIEVATLLPADTAQQTPKGARDTLPPPIAWWRVGLAAVALLSIALLVWWSRRRKRAEASTPDAYADAMAGFSAVDAMSLVDAGEPGRAMLAYAEVMRAYLTRRFPAAGDGLTTAEYVRALETHDLPIMPEEVRSVLEAADAVKFAAAPADAERVRLHAAAARGVVRDVQMAYEARLAALDKGKGPKGRRRSA